MSLASLAIGANQPTIIYVFFPLSTIVATLRDQCHPPLTCSFLCRLSSPLFEISATHHLRVPSFVDYRRHSLRSVPPTTYVFLPLSTIVATLRDQCHPPLTCSFLCRLSSPLFEISATHHLCVPSFVDYRSHSSRSVPPTTYVFLPLSTIVATLRDQSVIQSRLCFFLGVKFNLFFCYATK